MVLWAFQVVLPAAEEWEMTASMSALRKDLVAVERDRASLQVLLHIHITSYLLIAGLGDVSLLCRKADILWTSFSMSPATLLSSQCTCKCITTMSIVSSWNHLRDGTEPAVADQLMDGFMSNTRLAIHPTYNPATAQQDCVSFS